MVQSWEDKVKQVRINIKQGEAGILLLLYPNKRKPVEGKEGIHALITGRAILKNTSDSRKDFKKLLELKLVARVKESRQELYELSDIGRKQAEVIMEIYGISESELD